MGAPKDSGGVRPLAVGEYLRRLPGKVVMKVPSVQAKLRAMEPVQCGVGVPRACEMVALGMQNIVASLAEKGRSDWVVLKICYG